MRRRNFLTVVTAAAILAASLAGCGAQATKGGAPAKAPVQLIVDQPVFGPVPSDWQAVQNAVSKITMQKIDCTVKVNLINMGNYDKRFNLIMASAQPADIIYVGTMPTDIFTAPAADGEFVAMGKLLDQYGQGIKKVVDPAFLRCGCLNGHQYAVPLLESYADQNGFTMRKDLVDKYHIDLSKIKTPQDMTQVFATIKAHVPTMYPLTTGQETQQMKWYDSMGDSIGVLPNLDNNLKLVDLYETKRFAQQLDMIHSWYVKGYIEPVETNTMPFPMNSLKSGRAFAMPATPSPSWNTSVERFTGRQVVTVPMGKPYVTTFNVARDMYAIPIQCKHPEKAMQLLNLLYTNKDIVNLLDNGIKGKDYVMKSNGQIAYPPGVSPQNRYPGLGGNGIGNSFLSYVYTTDKPDLHQELIAFNNSAVKSKALGFQFNPASVKTQYAAVENVLAQYRNGLEYGEMDPATTLPVFIAKLKAAGIDKIIAAKQKQLDAWAKANNVHG